MKNIHLNLNRKTANGFELDFLNDLENENQSRFFYLSDNDKIPENHKCNKKIFSGTVAHELNNILLIIMSNADLLSLMLKKDNHGFGTGGLDEPIARVKEAVRRGKELIKECCAAEKNDDDRKILDIKPIAIEVLKQIRIIVSNNIRLNFTCDKNPWKICAKPLEIYQLIMNLCINSSQAMSGESEGAINLSLSNVKIMNDGIPGCCNIRRGEYLELTVSDNGKGMKKEILEKIFEPFFTTKNTEGLGLGLSVVNDIVSSLKGGMAVNSAYEKGTTFRIYLPKAKSEKFEKFLDK